jgi:hypothetical protein
MARSKWEVTVSFTAVAPAAFTQIKPAQRTFQGVTSGVNNNTTSVDPTGNTVYVGWKDTPLATVAIGGSFGPGTRHSLSGDDTVATGLAWDSTG